MATLRAVALGSGEWPVALAVFELWRRGVPVHFDLLDALLAFGADAAVGVAVADAFRSVDYP